MKRLVFSLAFGASLLSSSVALPCGGPFGPVSVPSQTIVVSHRNGAETYAFSPYFCGQSAKDFGIILPIPAALTAQPSLGNKAALATLESISAPERVRTLSCTGALDRGIDAGFSNTPKEAGVTVVDVGQVGVFDWSLLQATSAKAFTDWLDANGYPHTSADSTTFESYVSKGWYFVAFKISPPSMAEVSQTCGTLGPVKLAFPSAQPIVPAKIASASGRAASWLLYVLSDKSYSLPAGAGFLASRGFAGTVPEADVSKLDGLAASGDRLGKYAVNLYGATDDFTLASEPGQADYREKVVTYYYDQAACSDAGPKPDVYVPPSEGGSHDGAPQVPAHDASADGHATPDEHDTDPSHAGSSSSCAVGTPVTSGWTWLGVGLLSLALGAVRRRRPE